MKWFFLAGGAAALLTGCSRTVGEAAAPEAPGPLAPAVVEEASRRGSQLVSETFQLLSSNLQQAIAQGGISNALPYCSAAALPLTRSVSESRGAAVRRFTHRPRNPQARAIAVEEVVLERFREELRLTNAPAPVVTNTGPGTVTYFAPIVLSQPLCLRCHGEPGKDILPEDVAVIEKLYPRDEARGFKAGELRGGWRVDFALSSLTARE